MFFRSRSTNNNSANSRPSATYPSRHDHWQEPRLFDEEEPGVDSPFLNEEEASWQQPYNESYAPQPPARSNFTHIILAVSIVVVVSAGSWFAVRWFSVDGGPPPLIAADSTPYKIKPEDPGGMVIPHQDKLVYGHLSNKTQIVQEQITPTPEQPVQPQTNSEVVYMQAPIVYWDPHRGTYVTVVPQQQANQQQPTQGQVAMEESQRQSVATASQSQPPAPGTVVYAAVPVPTQGDKEPIYNPPPHSGGKAVMHMPQSSSNIKQTSAQQHHVQHNLTSKPQAAEESKEVNLQTLLKEVEESEVAQKPEAPSMTEKPATKETKFSFRVGRFHSKSAAQEELKAMKLLVRQPIKLVEKRAQKAIIYELVTEPVSLDKQQDVCKQFTQHGYSCAKVGA